MEALNLLAPFGVHISGIIHVGANTGHEFASYAQAGIGTVVYVEPTPAAFGILQSRVVQQDGHHAIQAVCSSAVGQQVTFNVASNGAESSSLFELGNHGILYPNIGYTDRLQLTTTTVDRIVETRFADKTLNLLVIDVQGAELLVLQGASRTLDKVEAVYCEIADVSLYEGSCTWPEISAFLDGHGFRLKYLAINAHNWGNALFLKEQAYGSALRLKAVPRPGINIALNKPATQSSLSRYSAPCDATGAVNGEVTGAFGFHTAKEDRPWWQVDLLEPTPLGEVLVFNRIDACAARAYSFVLKLGDEAGRFHEVYAQNGRPFGGRDGTPARIALKGAQARFVRIELTSHDHLHLDEVEVYAAPVARDGVGSDTPRKAAPGRRPARRAR